MKKAELMKKLELATERKNRLFIRNKHRKYSKFGDT